VHEHPDYTANVQRASGFSWTPSAATASGGSSSRSGFEAVAIQHEMDHLDGVLFLDRVVSVKTDLFRRKKYADPAYLRHAASSSARPRSSVAPPRGSGQLVSRRGRPR